MLLRAAAAARVFGFLELHVVFAVLAVALALFPLFRAFSALACDPPEEYYHDHPHDRKLDKSRYVTFCQL